MLSVLRKRCLPTCLVITILFAGCGQEAGSGQADKEQADIGAELGLPSDEVQACAVGQPTFDFAVENSERALDVLSGRSEASDRGSDGSIPLSIAFGWDTDFAPVIERLTATDGVEILAIDAAIDPFPQGTTFHAGWDLGEGMTLEESLERFHAARDRFIRDSLGGLEETNPGMSAAELSEAADILEQALRANEAGEISVTRVRVSGSVERLSELVDQLGTEVPLYALSTDTDRPDALKVPDPATRRSAADLC